MASQLPYYISTVFIMPIGRKTPDSIEKMVEKKWYKDMKFVCHYIFLLQLFVVVLLSLCLQFLIFSWNTGNSSFLF